MGIEPMLVDWDKLKEWPFPGSCRCVLEGQLVAYCVEKPSRKSRCGPA